MLKHSDFAGVDSSLFAGDWGTLPEVIQRTKETKYDYLLTSETIYNTGSYQKLIHTISSLLKQPF